MLRGDEQQIEGELMLKERKVYVPKNEELRMKIIQFYYNVPVARHRERQKTTEFIIRDYQQLEVTKDIGKYVDRCYLCQRIKNRNRTEVSVEKLIVNKILVKSQTHLIVDFITELLLVVEKNTILVVCDRLSKMTYFIAIIEGISANKLTRLFKDNVQKLHRLLESVISDRKPQFAAELTKELNRMLGIKTKLLTFFHPSTDGQTKQINQELEQYLQFFVDYKQKDWLE